MSHSLISASLLAALALGALGTGARAAQPTRGSADPSIAELQQKIQDMQAQLNALQSKQQLRSDSRDVDATVRAVLKDADQRSQFLLAATGGEQLTAGHEKGKFFIRDPSGSFSLSPSLQVQVRSVTNWADNADSTENGFEVRRAKFGFEGTIFTKDLGYKFVWATNRAASTSTRTVTVRDAGGTVLGTGTVSDTTSFGGSVFLEDAIVSYKLNDAWSLFGGQLKDPVHHEELVSSTRQLAVERALANELLGGGLTDRVQGVGVAYRHAPLNATVVFHDGVNSDNTNFRDSPANTTDYGVGGRIEYTVFGDNKQYTDFTARKNKSDMLVLGLGGDWTGGAHSNMYVYTADAQWENTRGTGVYVAAMGATTDGHGSGAGSSTDWGGLAQVGQMLNDRWEVFGRVGYVSLDDNATYDHIWEFTVGVNYYLFDHNAKLTIDVVYLPDGSPADSGLGYVDSKGEKQIVGRLQFQLAL